MKNVVFDTSVAIKWLFPEKGSEKAIKLKEEHLKAKILLCTRDLFLYEFTSALKNYTSIRIEEKDFQLAYKALQSLGCIIFPLEYDELGSLFNLAKELSISIYDSSYLLLAKKLKSPLYTSDNTLYTKAKPHIRAFYL